MRLIVKPWTRIEKTMTAYVIVTSASRDEPGGSDRASATEMPPHIAEQGRQANQDRERVNQRQEQSSFPILGFRMVSSSHLDRNVCYRFPTRHPALSR